MRFSTDHRYGVLPGVSWVVLVAAVLWGCDSGPRIEPPPETRVELVVDTIHGEAVPDPYRWLEDTGNPEIPAWVEEQNAYAEQIIGNPPVRAWLEARLRELNDRDDVGSPRKAGDYEYFTMRRQGEEVGAIYRRPAPPEGDTASVDPDGEYEKVLDPLEWAQDGTTSLGILSFSPDGNLLLYSVRDGGPDEYAVRVRDLERGEDLPDRLPPALHSSVQFTGDGSGFYYTLRSRDPEIGTRVRLHRLGTEMSSDVVLFGEGYGPSTYLDVREVEDGRYLLYSVRHGWDRSELYIQDGEGGPVRPIVTDADARFYHQVHDGQLYVRTHLGADKSRLMVVPLTAPELENWRELIPEAEDVMEDFTFIGDRIYVSYLHDVSSQIRVFETDGTPVGEIDVPEFHSASIRGSDPGFALLTLSSFTSPSTVWRLDLESGDRTIEEPPEIEWDASDVEVSQVWRTSRDGTRAPMFLVHRRGIELDGNNPTLLTGYGGFYVARRPGFSTTAAAWLEMGGVYALATLRGGSEYGESWHRDGMLLNKQHVFDDFLSAAEWLIENGYTRPERLAIMGGSNGGLLVGAALTQRPELFRAVVCSNPDLDILRFPWHYDANSPPAMLEYGNASIQEHFEAIRQYSPLQNVREGTAYPAVFFSTGALDTRVPPQGARKMAAHLQAVSTSGYPVILDYSFRAGHAGGRPVSDRIRLNAMQLTFLANQLGMEVDPSIGR
jgi:prolyl oligopeptidase